MSAGDPKPRVLIAAREPALRYGMRLALETTAECVEVDGPAAAIEAVGRERPDLCFLDADHGSAGVRTTELIRRLVPEANVVLLAHTVSEEEFLQAIRAGAVGYLSESIDPERLPHVVEGLLEGEAAVPRTLVRRLLDEFRNLGARSIRIGDHRVVNLTRREAEVLDLTREGLPTHAIARRLGISDVTVRRHRSMLFAKLEATSREDVLRLVEDGRSGTVPRGAAAGGEAHPLAERPGGV